MEVRSLKYKIKGQIEKILWITLFWTLFAIFQFLVGYITLVDFNIDLSNLNPVSFLMSTIFMGIIAGLLGGSLIYFFGETGLEPNPMVGHC